MIRRTPLWDRADKALLVFEALKNKYYDITDEQLSKLIEARVAGIAYIQRFDGDPVAQVASDVESQVRTLDAIETANDGQCRDVIRWLQAELLGRALSDDDYRTDAFVNDFNGVPPVRVGDIPAALRELELLCSWAIGEARLSPLSGRGALLAHIFSSVIRIHPFKDANGRTARFLVQYALYDWGMALLPIPKVRNDSAWRDALGRAMSGDIRPLGAEFFRRLGARGNT